MKTADLNTIKDRVKISRLIEDAGLNLSTVQSAIGHGRKPRELNQTESRLLRIQIRRLERDLAKILMK